MSTATVEFEPIGKIRTDYRTPTDMPIQGTMDPDSVGTVRLDQEYQPGLQDLNQFSHLVLIYYFHESTDSFELTVEPFIGDDRRGVFATRAPRRPNAIGTTVVELTGVTDNKLSICGIDVLDGTPLLDVKPYVPDVDGQPSASDGWIDGRMESRHLSDDRFSQP